MILSSDVLPSRGGELLKVPGSLLQQLSFLWVPPPYSGTFSHVWKGEILWCWVLWEEFNPSAHDKYIPLFQHPGQHSLQPIPPESLLRAAESMFDLYKQLPDCNLEGIQMGITARQWIKIYYMAVFILDPCGTQCELWQHLLLLIQ